MNRRREMRNGLLGSIGASSRGILIEVEGLMNARTLRSLTVLAVTLWLFGSHLAAQDADPILGTWVLNVAKSTFSPGPAPRSESHTYIMETDKTKLTAR